MILARAGGCLLAGTLKVADGSEFSAALGYEPDSRSNPGNCLQDGDDCEENEEAKRTPTPYCAPEVFVDIA